jgi:quinoprotein glucose dehydrogenase
MKYKMKNKKSTLLLNYPGFFLFITLIFSCNTKNKNAYQDWQVYSGSKDRIQYSDLLQIDTSNVQDLKIAWTYSTKDAEGTSQMQVNTIVIDGVLYGVSPKLKLFALDAETGKQKWVFDPMGEKPKVPGKKQGVNICRGVSFYKGENEDDRIFYTAGSFLYCINNKDGKPIPSFGNNGTVDLHNDLGRDVSDLFVTSTSPGIIYKNLLIIGTYVSEEAAAAPGHIRAYDVHTGKLQWIFHTIPQPGEAGYETWDDKEAYKHIGGANAWSGFSLDEEKGIVFAPTGSASYDFYGGKRLGDNLFANSVIALDAATGKLKWHYQTVHHDVWDKDLPSAPVLTTIMKDGKKIEVVVQVTKTGFLFVLDRATGKPVYPVEERPVQSTSDLAGERLSPTQPFPTFYPPFTRQSITEADLNTLVPDSSYLDIKKQLEEYKVGKLFTPPSKKTIIIFPGMQGGAEWGGPAIDPVTNILYINANEIPRLLTMVDAKEENLKSDQTYLDAGVAIYNSKCSFCHGSDRKGNTEFPSLVDAGKKYKIDSFKNLVSGGRARMPAFSQLAPEELTALASFVLNDQTTQKKKFTFQPKAKDPYHFVPYSSEGGKRPARFETKEGYPAISPPWGTITAINLNTGKIEWKNPLGDIPELKAKGIHSGTENFGGPVVTKGGIVFIAATTDGKFRAYNKRTGKILWETDLPAAGFATPSIYEIDGKQYVVIACGGGKLKTKAGDTYVAFTLSGK